MGEYTRGDHLMQMCYAFEFLSPEAPSGRRVGQVLRRFATVASDGWACWAFSNHDVERHATRWHLDAAQLRVYLALLLSLRGSVCLYQGEELGLTEAYVPFEELQDPYGKRFWPKFRGRDGCRTPMPWLSDTLHAGFSETQALAAGGDGARADGGERAGRQPGFDAGLLPPDAGLAEDAAGAGEGRLHAARDLRQRDLLCPGARQRLGVLRLQPRRRSRRPLSLPAGDWSAIEDRVRRARSPAGQVELPPYQALFAERA